MKKSEIYEVHGIILKWFQEKNKTPKDVIEFLTSVWIGQMAMNGYSEKFFDATLRHMKEQWENHSLNKVKKE